MLSDGLCFLDITSPPRFTGVIHVIGKKHHLLDAKTKREDVHNVFSIYESLVVYSCSAS